MLDTPSYPNNVMFRDARRLAKPEGDDSVFVRFGSQETRRQARAGAAGSN